MLNGDNDDGQTTDAKRWQKLTWPFRKLKVELLNKFNIYI